MSPFRNILKLSVGDFVAKALYFLAFVYLNRKLELVNYGVLEFAVAIRMYLVLLADGGIELWAVREAAKGRNIRELVSRVTPLRLMLGLISAALVNGVLVAMPENPNLKQVMPLFGLTVLVQAFNLKWVFMGQERMARVAAGLMFSQLAFAGLVFLLVQGPQDLIWVPIAWLAGDVIIVLYFARRFVAAHGSLWLKFTFSGMLSLLRPAFALGTSQALGLMNYNLGAILMGLMIGPWEVAWYAAAYKPVTAVLSVPVAYYLGLFPALARLIRESKKAFGEVLTRSLRMTAVFALPIGVGGTMLAEPMINFLFTACEPSIPILRILAWSAVLVTLRGNFRQALTAAGYQRMDMFCAAGAVAVNLCLNLLLIPKYKAIGAAISTVGSEAVWFALSYYCFSRFVMRIHLLSILMRPLVAAAGMGLFLYVAEPIFWMIRGVLSCAVYVGLLAVMGDPEILRRLGMQRTLEAEPMIAKSRSAVSAE
jgi:O-antigen/teichoic acid export membrane protein